MEIYLIKKRISNVNAVLSNKVDVKSDAEILKMHWQNLLSLCSKKQ